jgi:hypothetical protein
VSAMERNRRERKKEKKEKERKRKKHETHSVADIGEVLCTSRRAEVISSRYIMVINNIK